MNTLIHPSVVFGLPVVWLFAIYTLASYMTTRKAFEIKRFMKIYNVAQILVCGYMVWGMMSCIRIPNFFGIHTSFDEAGEWFVFVHYLSKYMDWFDTLWIILKKNRQQLSFLHVYHHATISMVWGFLLYSGVGNGTIRYGAWINSLTHVIMYSHYLWTSFGLKNPFKRYITLWQISQFYSCLAHAFIVRILESSACWEYAWIQICYQTTMVYLFTLKMSYVPSCTPDLNVKIAEPEMNLHATKRYVVIRGEVYDVTDFNHPGGKQMLDLAVGRDATLMFESAHIRDKPEKVLKSIPKGPSVEELERCGYTFDRPKELWPTPGQSKFYQTIRKRIQDEILKPEGRLDDAESARGVPLWHIGSVIVTWLATATLFVLYPSMLTGAVLGLAVCWIGLAIQHTANHGGLVRNPQIGYLLGLLNDVGPGGSSLVWRYHHQVSHHAYCNDGVLDQDAHSSYPILRMEKSQKVEPWHQFQWIYGLPLFTQLWASIHVQDFQCLLDARSFLVRFKGTSATEIVLAMCLKFVHFSWLYFLPASIHGVRAMILPWAAVLMFGSWWLAALFIVSHNLVATKEAEAPAMASGDWAKYQIETSSSWGGAIGSFFTGGLNLQIEHHLFPCMAHHLYSRAQVIVKEECKKAGVMYTGYDYFWPNLVDHVRFLYSYGRASTEEPKKAEKKVQ